MMIDGKPLPLPCLMSLRDPDPSRFDPIDLPNCGQKRIDNAGPVHMSNGMIGFQDRSGGEYFYYTDLGQWKSRHSLGEGGRKRSGAFSGDGLLAIGNSYR
jgi:hypothetical protein